MAQFFIDTATGQVATRRQLVEAGIADADAVPPRPWLRIQGSGDASTMWYAVMRKRERGVFIGTLVLRHGDHHTLLGRQGWEEVPVDEIRAGPAASRRWARGPAGVRRCRPGRPPGSRRTAR